MKASQIIDRAARTLADVQSVRWSKAELVDYINDGAAMVVGVNPDVSAATRTIRLVPGARQTVPRGTSVQRQVGPAGAECPEGVRFLRAVKNVRRDGATSGRAVRGMAIDAMNLSMPDWQSETRTYLDGGAVEMAAADVADRYAFYVYPAPAADQTVYVSVTYAKLPARVAVEQLGVGESDMELDDVFLGPLADYVLFRAFSKDADDTSNINRAAGHMTAFTAAIGGMKG